MPVLLLSGCLGFWTDARSETFSGTANKQLVRLWTLEGNKQRRLFHSLSFFSEVQTRGKHDAVDFTLPVVALRRWCQTLADV